VAIGWAWPKFRHDVHDDAAIFVVSPTADREQAPGRLAHLPMVLTSRHGA
jgi:hypothetical protein